MSGSSEEPPATMEAGPPEEMIDLKESCEQSKNQLVTVKDIMLKNKQSLKKKEEELQEYAKKLSKFKTRKATRSNKDDTLSSNESTPKSDTMSTAEPFENIVDDISQAKTPKAKSSLLQKKLAEDRKIFEQRSKEITQSKRAVEEKVEALRQQLEEKYVTPVSVVNPVLVATQANHLIAQSSQVQDKDNKISELNRKIIELEALIIDLQDNLKEKDSVIDSKTKAITLMSADLSRKGKTTLDTLEETKDEMRSMQENFVLLESSLRNKNESLIKQLEERNEHILKLEDTLDSLTRKLEAQKEAEVISADFSKSTMDTLVDTKDAMKAMQENFVLVEISLKSKNEYLLKQLEERELKLAEAEARILNLESGLGIERQPNIENLIYKVEKLEEMNHNLQDEKFELQKSIAELQDRFISSESPFGDKLLMERDSEIAELKDLKDELTKSNEILERDKEKLLQQIISINERNEAMRNEVTKLEKQVEEIRSDNEELAKRLTVSESDTSNDNDKVQKLTKELEELNKSLIKLKAQHKNKLKNVQKQLENFKKMSDTNAELVKLGNQVALLEEEKGNLQLSLVDFDELKASAGDWQKRIHDLEGKASAQAKEIQAHIEAIAILENQKLDLMQEQHSLKQEISSLEAENAESENLRVKAEMKLVDLEEELEAVHKARAEAATDGKEVGSSESFIKTGLNVDSSESTESLEALPANEAGKAELLRKIDRLTRENGSLLEKLTRFEESKTGGSSDTGSTESFERIPEHGLAEPDVSVRLDNLRRENYELVVKLTKLEERLVSSEETEARLQQVAQENNRLLNELAQLRCTESDSGGPQTSLCPTAESQLEQSDERGDELASRIENLAAQNESLSASLQEVERQNDELEKEKQALVAKLRPDQAAQAGQAPSDSAALGRLEAEIERCHELISEQKNLIEEMRLKVADKEEELAAKAALIANCTEASKLESDSLRRELEESASLITEWGYKCTELEAKLDGVEQAKRHIEEGFEALQQENRSLRQNSEQKEALVASLREEHDQALVRFEARLEEQRELVASRDQLAQQLRDSLASEEAQLQQKHLDVENYSVKMDLLRNELNKLQALLEQRDASIVSSIEELETWKQNSSALAEELLSARQQLTILHEILDKSKSPEEYQQLSDQLKLKESQVLELERTLAEKGREIEELKSRSEEFEREKLELRYSLQEEKGKLAELQVDKRKQEERLVELERVKLELESQLQELGAAHEQSTRGATEAMRELQEAYRQLEQLKIKHTEDMEMLNRRLENLLEELESKAQEAASLQNELEEKSKQLGNSVPEEVKTALEGRIAELQNKLAEAEERTLQQLEKMKKYAAVAKKKSSQCEELEVKLAKLEEKLAAETSEKDTASNSMQEWQNRSSQKDNRISELEAELRLRLADRDEALRNVDAVKLELSTAQEKWNLLQEELKELNEAKDLARELGVRMQVMEAEYVEQLALINSLKTENGLLLSKQAQINERLENVEKESEERLVELERIEKERGTAEEECSRCAARVQAFEEKLQERESQIENLNKELRNSIGDARSDALSQMYNELEAAHEELKVQQEIAERDREELSERAAKLEEANATMHERLEETDRQLSEAKELALARENVGAQYSQLLDQFERQRSELESVHSRLEETLLSSEKKEAELRERIKLFDKSNALLVQDAEAQPDPATPNRAKRQLDESLPLFDASVFETPSAQASEQERVAQLRQEISILNEDLKMSRLAEEEVKTRLDGHIEFLDKEMQTLQAVLAKRDEEILQLRAELSAVKQLEVEMEVVSDLLPEVEPKLEAKPLDVNPIELAGELEKTRSENEELKAMQKAFKLRLSELEKEARNSSDNAVIAELENRISRILSERDILQLQINEAKHAFDDLRESQTIVKSLHVQLQTLTQEKEQLVQHLKRLELPEEPAKVAVEVTAELKKGESPKALTTDSMWENDEDLWTFEDKTIPRFEEQHVDIPVVPSAEIQLKLKLEEIEELGERLSLMANEKAKLLEESKLAQVKNVKYAKKLKEYKLQLDALRQQMQSQKSLDSFGELNSAIEEELKGQIAGLEKALVELGEEKKKLTAEKENQTRRIEVLTAATERFTEAKEKQDTELHIWQMRYKELELQLQKLDFGPETRETSSSPARSIESWSEKPSSQLELKELRENMEALAIENEELQQLLEEQRSIRQTPLNEAHLRELESRLLELQTSNDKLKLDFESLRKQYEQTLMDADAETRTLRQNHELIRNEWTEREAALSEQLEAALAEKAEVESALAERMQEMISLGALQKSANLEEQPAHSKLDEREKAELPMFTFGTDANERQLQVLRIQLEEKNLEIQQLQDSLNDNSLAHMVQHLQDSINLLYNGKESLEKELDEKNARISSLTNELKEKEEERLRYERSLGQQEEMVKLQNALHEREQQLDQLKYALTEKESQLKDALEEAASDCQKRESAEKLRRELYESQTELEVLKFTVTELQSEVAALRGLERLAAEDRLTIQKLASEKEETRREAQESLKIILEEKESEINKLKQELAAEKRNLIESLGLRERDTENLRIQIEQNTLLEEKGQLLGKLENELSDRDRKLVELSITKDAEIHNLRVQLSEKMARIEELTILAAEEERQLIEVRKLLEVKEQQIIGLSQQLDEKSKEFELIQRALQRHMPSEFSTKQHQQVDLSGPAVISDSSESSVAKELDVALYMLHQRDVRCEELTLELMQLLEERDTLQLRLSNAIRVNEELRKCAATNASAKKLSSDQTRTSETVLLVDDPSPFNSEGSAEIIKGATNLPIDQDNKALAQNARRSKSIERFDELAVGEEHAKGSAHVIENTEGNVQPYE